DNTNNNDARLSIPIGADPPDDLAVSVSGPAATPVLGGNVSAQVLVRNSGTASHAGSVTVQVGMGGLVGSSPLAFSGTGWSCDTNTYECIHAGPVAAGAALPALTVSATAGTDPNTYSGLTVAVTASLVNAGDDNT